MFDIGFTELVMIAVVGLLVIGPERLPGAIRTGSAWLARFRRSFNDIKREVEQELHNDEVMQDLKRSSGKLRDQASLVERQIRERSRQLGEQASGDQVTTLPTTTPDKNERSEPGSKAE